MKRYRSGSSRHTSSYTPLSVRRNERKSRNKFIFTSILSIFFIYAFIVWLLPFFIGEVSVVNKIKDKPLNQTTAADNATLAPPVLSIPFEATNSPQIKVKGYSIPKAKVEIYIDNTLKDTVVAENDGGFISREVTLNYGTNNIFGKSLDEKGTESLASKPIKVIFDDERPKLTVSQPLDNQQITGRERKINVSGKVPSGENIVVTVNQSRVIVSSDGNFSQTIELVDGDNPITVQATDFAGNTSQLAIKVTYQPS